MSHSWKDYKIYNFYNQNQVKNILREDKHDLFNNKSVASFFKSKYYPLVFQVLLIIFLAGFIIQGLGEKEVTQKVQ